MNREIDAALIEVLSKYDTPSLANAIETFQVRPRDTGYTRGHIRAMFPEHGTRIGFAATATITAIGEPPASEPGSDKYAALYEHVNAMPGPVLVVEHDTDVPLQVGSMWGEVNAAVFKALGAIGAVTDGTVRDTREVGPTGFSFFAANVGVSHGYVRLESVAQPVEVDGLPVAPGDLLAADQYGVLAIPIEIVHDLPAAVERVIDQEQSFIRWVRSDDFSFERLAATRVKH